jgi:hypothetical protein
MGWAEFKPRDLRDDRGYGVAEVASETLGEAAADLDGLAGDPAGGVGGEEADD